MSVTKMLEFIMKNINAEALFAFNGLPSLKQRVFLSSYTSTCSPHGYIDVNERQCFHFVHVE